MLTGLLGLFVMSGSLPSREVGAADDNRPVVVVIRPEAVGGGGESELPGNFEPFERALLHSRAAGYLSRMNVDIGDRIKRGAPLATLLIPEMESELLHAEADVIAAQAEFRRTEAVAKLSDLTSRRLSDLQAGEPLAVTRQDVDVAAAEAHVSRARVESAAAAVDVARAKQSHLEALMSYATIRAPFDGIVVRRFVDPGALIVSGTDGGGPLLEVVNADRLRLVLSIPDSVAPRVRVGLACRIHVDALPRHEFTGVISRIAGALAVDSRTMRAEIDIDSEDGLLRPGMYATVKLQLHSK